MTLRPARPEEAAEITALALRSKAHWGYGDAFLEACREELTWTADRVLHDDVLVVAAGDALVGFAARSGTAPSGVLDAVFVDPDHLARGIGRRLLDAALERARAAGFRALEVEADPNAEGFYLARGAIRVGEVPSGSIPGRVLPLLHFDLG